MWEGGASEGKGAFLSSRWKGPRALQLRLVLKTPCLPPPCLITTVGTGFSREELQAFQVLKACAD